ncbi:restriction endonuclease subunit S [Lactococcus cremoris]|uniref:restriction endonuclease subunit S n=2 Tax=Lactococcus lactis subsp. cremoris TaxID=1359 RepID=UPI0024BD4010|nr:restriction endonuclease subunit S [Lactococcus cremoris]
MMSKKSPQLRFEGFTDDWEERKLGDFIKISREQEVKKVDLHEEKIGYYVLAMRTFDFEGYIDYSKPYWINNFESADDDLFLNRKEFAIIDADMDASLPKIGKVLLNATNNKFLLAAHIRKIKVDVQVDSIFAYALMRTTELVERLKLEANGSISKRLLDKNVYKQKVYLPIHLEEQQQIGEFFWTLEETITLHQRKLDLLKEQKKGYLQKMFPKNGAKVPELRFAGFADDWEERKFFESIASTIDFRGRTPKKLGMDWSDSGYLALSALNVKNGYIDPLADAHYGDEKLYRKWMSGRELKKGQVLFTTEAPMGNVAQVPDDNGYILSQRTVAFETKEDMMTNDFLAVLLKSPLVFNNLSALSSGGTAKGVSQKSLKGLSITVPLDIDEQQKIGSFFKQLDDTIALHQRKLDLLKEQKKGFLQKMFV